MGSSPKHRDVVNDIGKFARKFIDGRLTGFDKDMKICLTPVQSKTRSGMTHAYFPALAACCGTLEYFTALHRGSVRGVGWQQVSDWAGKFLPQPDYNREVIRTLIEAFRHPVAHRGIASGVWIDRRRGDGRGRRITWKIHADAKRPAFQILEKKNQLVLDPPWPCPYTHRAHIHLRALWIDIRKAAKRYRDELKVSQHLQRNFEACMRQLYPR